MKAQPFLRIISALLVTFATSHIFVPQATQALPQLIFPVVSGGSYSNDFYASRAGGTTHNATDIFAPKHRQLVSVVDGTITSVIVPQASWGYSITIKDAQDYTYRYIHMNNDTPGTDDGNGREMNAYAPDMKVGNPVVRGQLIGYLGDSGNAETTAPHLHFEMFAPDGAVINPWNSLNEAQRIGAPLPYPKLPSEILPYHSFMGGASIAMGNLAADTAYELVTGAGAGAGPHVKAMKTDGTELASFYAFDPGFRGGVDVGTGDVDGDGIDEIIVGAGPSAGPHVKVFRTNGQEIASFYAFHPSFSGGIKVNGGDVDGDGKDDIIVGAGPGAGPHVKAFRFADGAEIASFYAFDPRFPGGIDVAAADLEGTTADEIIVGAGAGAGPHIKTFRLDGMVELSSFYAYDPAFRGGIRVSGGNVRTSSPKSEIVVVPAAGAGPHTRVLTYNGTLVTESQFMESWWMGYHDIGAGLGASRATTGVNRRTSVRVGPN